MLIVAHNMNMTLFAIERVNKVALTTIPRGLALSVDDELEGLER